MVSIDKKALKYAKTKNLSFVIKGSINTVACECNSCKIQIKNLQVKLLYESEIEKDCYNAFEFDGIKVFISKDLKTNGDVLVYQKIKLPFKMESFGVKGIDIQ